MAKENIESCGKKNKSAREIELEGEIVSLKHQLGGLKKSNANYRKKVEQLNGQVEHYNGLDIDGDELYDKKLAACQDLQKQLDMANLTIGELRGQIAYYNNQILEYKDRIASLQEENNGVYDEIEYEQKPWWKKIF